MKVRMISVATTLQIHEMLNIIKGGPKIFALNATKVAASRPPRDQCLFIPLLGIVAS
jgi:hypothetical protein